MMVSHRTTSAKRALPRRQSMLRWHYMMGGSTSPSRGGSEVGGGGATAPGNWASRYAMFCLINLIRPPPPALYQKPVSATMQGGGCIRLIQANMSSKHFEDFLQAYVWRVWRWRC
jgi:hypothetical protein